jgi:ectoine hydroxylase-related dioxygenase (phytanoyl-CoA dioxygenase family)
VPENTPPLTAVPAKAGDAIVFTEATTHGSTLNTSGLPRRTLYYCYSTGWMPDWGGQSLHFSPGMAAMLSPAQAEIIRLK